MESDAELLKAIAPGDPLYHEGKCRIETLREYSKEWKLLINDLSRPARDYYRLKAEATLRRLGIKYGRQHRAFYTEATPMPKIV